MVMRFLLSAWLRVALVVAALFAGLNGIGPNNVFAAEAVSLAPSSSAPAPTNSMSIAAIVNEDIITVYDVQSRLALYLATSGLDDTPDVRRRLMPQVVNALIDEHLQTQEAKKDKVTVSDAEIRQSVDGIEQRNGLVAGAFRAMLAEHGVDVNTLYAQIEAQLDWVKVVRKELTSTTTIAPQEVEAVLTRLKANQGKPEHLLSEIVLPVGNGTSEETVRELAQRLVAQARSGTPFPNLASQFSQSATAAVGGSLGWVVQGELEPEIDAVVARMEPNEISDPIRTATGYHIIQLQERRSAGEPDPKLSIVTLSQIYLPNLGGRAIPPEKIAQLSDSIRTQIKDCNGMNKWAKDVGGPGSGPIPMVYVGGLPDKVRDAIISLKPDQVSEPIEVGGARLFVMICTRKDDSGIPSPEQIQSNLQNEKLTNAARQKLVDLRRAADIEVRI